MDLETSIEYYKDNLGRMDLKPVNRGEASTNNQLLYTGELAILMKLSKIPFLPMEYGALYQAVATCHLNQFPGLYTRHPEPYRFQAKFTTVSFDEILGACFTNWAAGNIKANEHILEHAQLTNNRFCDVPGYELMDSYKSVFKGGLRALWQDLVGYYKEAKTYDSLEKGFRKSVGKFPRFFPVFFKHGASDLLIYAAGANRNIPLLGSLALFASVLVASVKKDNLSTKMLWWFRFRFLELTGKENVLTKLAKQFYNYSNENRLGESWEKELFKAYYPEGHPFHELREKI